MACFAVAQGSIATYAKLCGIFGIHLTTNLARNLQVKKNVIGSDLTELWPWVCGHTFLAHPVDLVNESTS